MLASLPLEYSKAQEVSAAPVITQTYQIGDDSWANVPLQFNFPFYGQSFNNSWLYSNGAIGFISPNQGGLGGNNLSVREFVSNMGSQFNYTIYPLWTDLLNINGTFQTEGSTDFQRYKWIGISPYADGNRLNTFTVEIKPDGQINTNYSLVNVNYATIGIVGDASKNEYEQIYRFNGQVNTGMVSDWSRYTSVALDPCVENPTSSPICPGYGAAMLKTINSTISEPAILSMVTDSVVEQPSAVQSSLPQQTQQSTTQSAPEPTQTAQVLQSSSPASTQEDKKESKGGGASLSTVLSILKNEQDRISSVESKVVEAANEQAQAAADRTVEQAVAIAEASSTTSMAASESTQMLATSSGSSTLSQAESTSQSTSSQQLLMQQQSSVATSNQTAETATQVVEALGAGLDSSIMLQNTGLQIENRLAPITEVELPKLDAFKVGLTTPADDFMDQKLTVPEQSNNQTTDTVKNPSQTNQLAVGVSFDSLATTPTGYAQYNIALKDVPFYEPKEIYKGQKTVDNVRALRQLSSDKLHQEMVEQQYRR